MRSSLAATTPTATLRILRRGICSARGQQAILRRLFDAVDAGQQGLGGEHQVAAHLAGPQRPATARADVLGAGMLARDQAQKRGKSTTAGKHPGGLQRHRQSGRVGRADMRDAHQQATVGIGLHRRGQSRAGRPDFFGLLDDFGVAFAGMSTIARQWPLADSPRMRLRERADRPEREAQLELQFGVVTIARPRPCGAPELPAQAT